jgi:hypothetical protein
MNARLKINMLEVTRLTCDGRLDEAMAILRGAIPSSLPSNLGGGIGLLSLQDRLTRGPIRGGMTAVRTPLPKCGTVTRASNCRDPERLRGA